MASVGRRGYHLALMIGPGYVVGGKYRLVEKVGEGGMATVWRATHTHLGREVAVKFLSRTASRTDGTYERFLEEAKIAASVRHRNVVDIVDFGVAEDGRPFMVLEYMKGESLADRMEREPPLTIDEIVSVVALALGGLAAVHDQGIVHRDLKPENLFLTSDADGTYPKLLDFGISKDLERSESGERRVRTRDGVILGTPQYMSPEQARGLPDVDRRSDLYSVGVLLYELLAGVRPFEAEHIGDVLMRVIDGRFEPLAKVRPELPQPLVAVVEKALSKERDARYPDARAMRAALLASVGMTQTTSLVTHLDASRSEALSLSTPLPAEGGSRLGGRLFLGAVVLLAVALVGAELSSPGRLASFARAVVGDGAEARSAGRTDGGADAGLFAGPPPGVETIHVRLRELPDDATLVLDGRTYPPEHLRALRSGEEGLVDLELTKQSKPFEIRVEAPGFLPFEGRRFAIEDVSYRIHLEPIPPDAGLPDASVAAGAESPVATAAEAPTETRPTRTRRPSRRRHRPR